MYMMRHIASSMHRFDGSCCFLLFQTLDVIQRSTDTALNAILERLELTLAVRAAALSLFDVDAHCGVFAASHIHVHALHTSSALPAAPALFSSTRSCPNLRRSFSTATTSSTSSPSTSHGLTHVDSSGTLPGMVDVSGKSITQRSAEAHTYVLLPENVAAVFRQHGNKDFHTPKGPVFVTAIIAGTNAVKRTSDLIPFCHPLPLDHCRLLVNYLPYHPHSLGPSAIEISCHVRCTGKTGVEMEALVGASVAALTCYDMLKAISHEIVISDTKLIKKTGGKSNYKTQLQADTNNGP